MKRLLTSMVLLAALAVMPANAKIKYGVKVGMNDTQLRLNYKDIFGKCGCGWFIGPTTQLTLPLGIANIGGDVSVLYDYRHTKAETGGATESIKQHSILLPINARVKFSFLKVLGAYFATGPQFGFNIGKNDVDLTNASSFREHFQLKRSQFSWNIGLGVTVMSHVEVGVTYNFGIGKSGELKSDENILATPRQNMWTVSAAYYF